MNERRRQSTQIRHSTFNNNLICFHSLLWTFFVSVCVLWVSHHFTGLSCFLRCAWVRFLLSLLPPMVLFLSFFASYFSKCDAGYWSVFSRVEQGQFVCSYCVCALVVYPLIPHIWMPVFMSCCVWRPNEFSWERQPFERIKCSIIMCFPKQSTCSTERE